MTQTQQLLECLAKHGTMTAAELAQMTGIPHKSISGLLATPTQRGLALRCDVTRDNRAVIEYKIGVAYTKKAGEALQDPLPGKFHGNTTREPSATVKPVAQTTEVAAIVQDVVEPLVFIRTEQPSRSTHQTHANELQAALDTIHTLKQQMARMTYEYQLNIAANLVNIQHVLSEHISLVIGRDDINVENAKLGIVITCKAEEVPEAISSCNWLQSRLAA